MSQSFTAILSSFVAASALLTAAAEEKLGSDLYPVDFAAGRAPVAGDDDVETAGDKRPRPLSAVSAQSITVQERVPERIAGPVRAAPLAASPAVEDVQQAPHIGDICCPITGPVRRYWHCHTKPGLQASHWGYPQYYCERPFGSYVLHSEHMQIVNGLQNQQVLYHYDFGTGADEARLSLRGVYQLEKIVRRMQLVPGPVILQQTDERPELDEARRHNVVSSLAEMGVPATEDLVFVARSPVPGLQGTEGLLIYQNLLIQTRDRGGPVGPDTDINIGSASAGALNAGR